MGYLGIDPTQALRLAHELRLSAGRVDAVEAAVAEAQLLADLTVPVHPLLEQVQANQRIVAAHLERAARSVRDHMLWFDPWTRTFPNAPRASTAAEQPSRIGPHEWSHPAPWAARPLTPWNQIHQLSAHNSFVSAGGVPALYDLGLRSFEFDLHRGRPTSFAPPVEAIVVDHFTHGGGRSDDWLIYHTSLDPHTEYEHLSDGLRSIASLPEREPITLFLDLKDDFAGTHNAAALDELLVDSLGDRLFVPQDLLDRAPGARSLHAAIDTAGWPTVDELEGRVLVVLTGKADGYLSPSPRAFLTADAAAGHDPDFAFFNAKASRVSSEDLDELLMAGSIVRTWGNHECPNDEEHPPDGGQPHHWGIDIEPGDDRSEMC